MASAGTARATIDIDGEIGYWGVTARDFKRSLKDLGDVQNIKVRLNTVGGSVGDGVAIKNALRDHDAKVHIQIDGYALSIGSVIAMAGDSISASEDSLFMIHNPWSVAVGDSNDMRHEAEVLEKHEEAIVAAYLSRGAVDLSAEELREAMNHETWYTAEEAKEAGFIDRINTDAKNSRSVAYAKFDPTQFKNAPEGFLDRLSKIEPENEDPRGSTATQPTEGKTMPKDAKTYSQEEFDAAVEDAKKGAANAAAASSQAAVEVNQEAATTLVNMMNDPNATIERVRKACSMGLNAEQAGHYFKDLADAEAVSSATPAPTVPGAAAAPAAAATAAQPQTAQDLLKGVLAMAERESELNKVNLNGGTSEVDASAQPKQPQEFDAAAELKSIKEGGV